MKDKGVKEGKLTKFEKEVVKPMLLALFSMKKNQKNSNERLNKVEE